MDSVGVDLAVYQEHAGGLRSRQPAAPEQSTQAPSPQGLARQTGNQGFGQIVARMRDGEGILEDGIVHPDVEVAIAAARGSGRPLDRTLSAELGNGFGEDLSDVRLHTGPAADTLARAVSARAFTVGNDIFFAGGEYQPGTKDGRALIAHETAHVLQQRGAPASGPLTVSQPGDALEVEAEALARDIAG